MREHGLIQDVVQKSRLYMGLWNAKLRKKPMPVITNLFITGRCNARCSYCYVEIDKKPAREFSLEQWKKLIDELYLRGTRMFGLVGGEPLLHPDIDKLVDYISAKNVFLNLTTNGFLLPQHLVMAKKATEVSISLDGDIEAHEKNRGKGTFEKAVKGIEAAINHGINVRLCAVITRYNFDQIDFLLNFAEQYNTFISFTPLIDAPEERRETADKMRLSDDMIRKFFIQLKDAKRGSCRIINSRESIDYMIGYPVQYGSVIWKNDPQAGYYPKTCPYGQIQYLISNSGEVYPCAIKWNNDYFKPKNVFDFGIDEALFHASNELGCQCCSFANAVEWNSVTTLPWLWYGITMTARQFLKKGR